MIIEKITINGIDYMAVQNDENKGFKCEACEIQAGPVPGLASLCTACIHLNGKCYCFKKAKPQDKTYFQLLRELNGWKPKDKIITSEKEVMMIAEHFGLESMSVIELRNLRDMTVSYHTALLSDNKKKETAMLAMMSITTVIDNFLIKKGSEM